METVFGIDLRAVDVWSRFGEWRSGVRYNGERSSAGMECLLLFARDDAVKGLKHVPATLVGQLLVVTLHIALLFHVPHTIHAHFSLQPRNARLQPHRPDLQPVALYGKMSDDDQECSKTDALAVACAFVHW